MKKSLLCAVFIVACCLLTSCSAYKNFEDNLKGTPNQNSSNQGSKAGNGGVIGGKQVSQTGEQPTEKIASNKIHPLGKVISFNIGAGSTTMEYCATKAVIFSSLSEAGIKANLLGDPSVVDAKGNFNNNAKLLVVEVTVKNIDTPPDQVNISELGLTYNDQSSGEAITMPEIDYFSNPKDFAKNYYAYNLAIGETKNVKLGWLVNLDSMKKSDLFLCVGHSTSLGYREYVKLGL